jgi:hypothetical protein
LAIAGCRESPLITWLDVQNGATEAGDFWRYEITESAGPLLVLTDAEGVPCSFKLDGWNKEFVFTYSFDRSDQEILAEIEILQWAGFKGARSTRVAQPEQIEEWAKTHTVLLNAPLMPTGQPVSIKFKVGETEYVH